MQSNHWTLQPIFHLFIISTVDSEEVPCFSRPPSSDSLGVSALDHLSNLAPWRIGRFARKPILSSKCFGFSFF